MPEIKMSFSPTKLVQAFSHKDAHVKQSSAFELKQIEIGQQFKATTSNTTVFNAGFMEKMRQKRSESAESPREKEMRFKEMREKRLRDIEKKLAKWD